MAVEVQCVTCRCDDIHNLRGAVSFYGCFISKASFPRKPSVDFASFLIGQKQSHPLLSQPVARGLGLSR